MVPRVLFDTARFTVRVRVYPAAGTVYDGTGAVWQKPTRGIPVLNPSDITSPLNIVVGAKNRMVSLEGQWGKP